MSSTIQQLLTITIVEDQNGNSDSKLIKTAPSETILESLEKNAVIVQYHCRDGFCGACRSKLIDGHVEYTSDPLAFIDDDEFLPCCTKATTDIKIEIS